MKPSLPVASAEWPAEITAGAPQPELYCEGLDWFLCAGVGGEEAGAIVVEGRLWL